MRRRSTRIDRVLLPLLLCLCAVTLQSQPPAPAPAWPQWRGPARDGVAAGAEPRDRWPDTLPKVWEVPVGRGYSTPIVAAGQVFVHAHRDGQETVAAYESATGRELWQHSYPAPYRVNTAARAHGPGPKASPAYANGRLFTFGISGILSAFEASTGKLLWRHQPEGDGPMYGTATSPLVAEGKLILFVGGHDRGALTAFAPASGEIVWQWTGGAPAYASPVVATLAGVPQVVTQSRTDVVGVALADGTLLWRVPFTTAYDQNSVTPLVVNDTVVYSGLSNGTAAVRIVRRGDRYHAEEQWRNAEVSMYMSSPVLAGDTIIGLAHRNRGQFFALDVRSGKTLWTTRGREADNAALIRVPGHTLIQTTGGQLIVVRDSRTSFDVVRRYDVADGATWAHPALAGGRLFVRDADSLTLWTFP